MKKFSILLLALAGMLACTGCGDKEATQNDVVTNDTAQEVTEQTGAVISPLPATIDMNNLDNCTVAVSFEKGDVYLDDTGALQMKAKVYTYDLYDMVDIAALKEGDSIVRLGETVEITSLERKDTGLIVINGGEENGGFDLISNDSTVYYECGMNDVKAYYELGEATLRVSTEFTYTDASVLDAEPIVYYPGDFLTDEAGIEYNFNENNTEIVIQDGMVIAMTKNYQP